MRGIIAGKSAGKASVLTVLVGDLNVDEEEVEAPGVGADELGERPVEGGAAADGGVRVPLERRLVHRHHHSRRRRRVRHCSARTPRSLARAAFLVKKRRSFGGNFEQMTKGRPTYFFLHIGNVILNTPILLSLRWNQPSKAALPSGPNLLLFLFLCYGVGFVYIFKRLTKLFLKVNLIIVEEKYFQQTL